MNKLISISTLVLSLCLFANSQTKRTDREEAGLVGSVKSVSSSSADYSGDKIVGEGFMKNGGDLVIYDEAGREIERQPISDFGEAMGKISRNFGKDGLLAESIWTDPKGDLLRKDVFNYLNGKVSEMFTYNAAAVMVEKTVYSYDDKARLSAETYYDSAEPVAKTVYKYDGLDKPAEIAFFMADGSKATAPVGPCLGAHRVTFSYDQKGKTIGQVAFETDGSQKRGYRWKYDGKGNIAEYFTETSGHSVNFVYRYEFDAKGNWIKRIATGTSIEKGLTVFGKPAVPYVRSTVTKREIAYY